jgi:hypothetical protein
MARSDGRRWVGGGEEQQQQQQHDSQRKWCSELCVPAVKCCINKECMALPTGQQVAGRAEGTIGLFTGCTLNTQGTYTPLC